MPVLSPIVQALSSISSFSAFVLAMAAVRLLLAAVRKRHDARLTTQVVPVATSKAPDFIEILQGAAERGDAVAQYKLASHHHARSNFTEASAWYLRAVAQGDAGAATNLATLYAKGHGVPQNLEEAVRLFRFAAERNDATGQFNLALCFRDGRGVPQDPVAASVWLRKAADQGDSDAKVILGAFYEHGCGVTQDFVEAATWYGLAAAEGQPRGQGAFGFMYAEGRGVPHDLVKAYAWFSLAARSGDANAITNVGIASRKMTAAQVAAAQRLATDIDLQLQAAGHANHPVNLFGRPRD